MDYPANLTRGKRTYAELLREADDLDARRSVTAAGNSDYELCGSPHWNEAAWDRFRAQYGEDPYTANNRPPSMEDAPEWVWRRIGLHAPPVFRRPR